MRGHSVWKEPPSPSFCAFCAHRLGASRRPRIQRRFIQSSQPARKPPAEGATFREDNKDENTIQSRLSPSWGSSIPGANNLGHTPRWGSSIFGKSSTPSTGPSASWGQTDLNRNGIPIPIPGSGQVNHPDMSDLEGLLPHEQRARNLIREKEQAELEKGWARRGPLHAGPGPQSTRAGRAEPRPEGRAKDITRREEAALQHHSRKNEQKLNSRQVPIRHKMGIGNSYGYSETQSLEVGEPSNWSQLRRRSEVGKRVPEAPPALDAFAEARAQREEQAESQRYIPLGSGSILSQNKNDTERPAFGFRSTPRERTFESGNRTDPNLSSVPTYQSRPINQDRSDSFRSLSSLGQQRAREFEASITPVHQPPRDQPIVKYSPMQTSSKLDRGPTPRLLQLFPESPVNKQPSKKEEKRDRDEEAVSRMPQRKASGRFGAEDYNQKSKSTAIPKGKARDKAKRRQQFADDYDEDNERELEIQRAELKKQKKREKAARKAAASTPILLPEYISVSNLAVALKVRVEDFMDKMEELGFEERSHDHILNAEDAGLIAGEYNFEAIIDYGESEDLKARPPAENPSILPTRPPVVTIMGHVDHGKTTILDWLRKSSVAATEHGGITQHIGAFSVLMPSGKTITFLDTPGHAAFLNMRQRGAHVTDIVILVVAADDSVKPQTIEAINHAKNAKVPIIVAINKIDKEDINIERVKQDLSRHGVDIEDFGGDTQVVCVSGKTGQGMGDLEEAAVTLSEILDMRAETDGPAEGWVIEASIKSMGKVATVLVKRGTMKPGDFIVAGNTWSRIRCLRNEAGVEIEEATPGSPVQIDGWREQPTAGDKVLQAPDEAKAKSVIDYRLEKVERDKMAEDMEAINEHRKVEQEKREHQKNEAPALKKDKDFEAAEATELSGTKQIYFIVKGDVSGSVEAVQDSILAIGNNEVHPVILRSGVGQISEFDIEHAAAAKGLVVNFNNAVDPHISRLAEISKVKIMDHNIIYRLVDDVKAQLSAHLPPKITYPVLGEAEIAQIFSITIKGRKQKNIAGCKVKNGTISRNAKYRVLRGGEKVFDGLLASLKNVKKDVMEMNKGSECGIGFENWFDFQVGDQVQAYEEKHEKRYL
ncbi:hypothetical protein B7494_g6145 [Chlorociboria aeruginascens]|nr:hypothetical protein B7494_g6145 [Chlorociboria aeruginascens]